MAEYEIVASLQYADLYKEHYTAVSSACGVFDTFEEALIRFCYAITDGYTVDRNSLNEYLTENRSSDTAGTIDESRCGYSLTLLKTEYTDDIPILENAQQDGSYAGDDHTVSILNISPEEKQVIADHQLSIEEDALGSYFELYPLNDLVYDLCDSMEDGGDPKSEELRELIREYLLVKGLVTNEIDPAEDGYFCPGVADKEECFAVWGRVYGYEKDEKDLFIQDLVPYKNGFIMEFRD